MLRKKKNKIKTPGKKSTKQGVTPFSKDFALQHPQLVKHGKYSAKWFRNGKGFKIF